MAMDPPKVRARAPLRPRCWCSSRPEEAKRSHHLRRFTDPDLDAALVIDAHTSAVLYAGNAGALRHPASLTKMMTLYLLFEQLRQHRVALATELPVSANAAKQPRSHLRLHAGDTANTCQMLIPPIRSCRHWSGRLAQTGNTQAHSGIQDLRDYPGNAGRTGGLAPARFDDF